MKKITIACCLIALCNTGNIAFAQFKNPAKITTNLHHLDRIVTRTSSMASRLRGEMFLRVPPGVIRGNFTVLTATQLPQKVTAANACLAYRHMLQSTLPPAGPDNLLSYPLQHAWIVSGGKAFYEDQSTLAQDLDRFYNGGGVTRQAPGGKIVKLYTLPVDGVLYKPVGSRTVVLKPEDYFIVYDVQTQTGQIIENTPGLLSAFSKPANSGTFEELFVVDGETFYIPMGPSETGATPREQTLDSAHNLLQANKERVAGLRANQVYDDIWKENAKKTYTSQNELGNDLANLYHHQAPQFRQHTGKNTGYVYELPVEGITYAPAGRQPEVLDPETKVVFHIEGIGSQILDRKLLENNLYFELVTQ